ncbi:MAG: LysM peptidoglycan-binding domain-containing protein, partial [Bacillus sp. (in: firmicutes)]
QRAGYEARESSIIQQEKYEEAESAMNQRAGYEARESSIIQQEKYEEAESTMNPQMGYGEQPSAPLGVEQESLAVPQERDADYESTTLSSDDHIDQKLPYLQTEYYSEQESAVQSVSLDESESIAPRAVQNEEETGESTVQSEAALLQVESEYESFEVSAYALPREESAERQEPMAPELPAFDHKPFSFQSHFAIPMPIFTPPDIPDYPDIVGADARNEEVQEPAAAEIEVESSYQTFNYSLEEAEEVSVRSSKNESGPVIAKQEERPAASVEPEEPPQQPVESAPLNRPIYKVAEVESEEKRPLAETGKLSVSLTDFFAKKETQTKTKLKVCIVQNGENLSDLAARYEINKQDIIAYNHLEDESEVQGGKVLYIPQKAGHK